MAARLIVGALALHPPSAHALTDGRVDHVELAQPPRGRVEYVPVNISAPLHACRRMPQSYAPTIELIRRHSQAGAVVATFTNAAAAKFALNWARQLQAVGLKSIIGVSQRLGAETENELRAAGAGLFCADGEHMQLNGQAGRWSEVWPLLRAGVHVLLSDSDIAWMRNPLPYFEQARHTACMRSARTLHVLPCTAHTPPCPEQVRLRHPRLDYLMCTDTAYNNYAAAPLVRGLGSKPGPSPSPKPNSHRDPHPNQHARNRRRRLRAEEEALVEQGGVSSGAAPSEASSPQASSSPLLRDEDADPLEP